MNSDPIGLVSISYYGRLCSGPKTSREHVEGDGGRQGAGDWITARSIDHCITWFNQMVAGTLEHKCFKCHWIKMITGSKMIPVSQQNHRWISK